MADLGFRVLGFRVVLEFDVWGCMLDSTPKVLNLPGPFQGKRALDLHKLCGNTPVHEFEKS